MNKIILSARDWRIYRALWLLMVMALVVDLCAVLMESDLLTTTAATLTAVENFMINFHHLLGFLFPSEFGLPFLAVKPHSP